MPRFRPRTVWIAFAFSILLATVRLHFAVGTFGVDAGFANEHAIIWIRRIGPGWGSGGFRFSRLHPTATVHTPFGYTNDGRDLGAWCPRWLPHTILLFPLTWWIWHRHRQHHRTLPGGFPVETTSHP